MSKQHGNGNAFSARSQASLKRQAELQEQLAHVDSQIDMAKSRLAEEEESRSFFQRAITIGRGNQGMTMPNLDRCLLEIKALNLRLETLGQMKSSLEANIEAECAIPEDRAGVQDAFASVARKCLEFDAGTEKLIAGLRERIAKRPEFTRELKGLAERIEFTGDLDEERWTRFLALLRPMLPDSERWYVQNIGKEGKGLVRAVARISFELAETLHYSGMVKPGDEVLLTEEHFAALSRSEFRLSVDASCWAGEEGKHFTPRRVVSADQFEDNKVGARNAAVSIADFWAGEDFRELEAAKQARSLEIRRRAWDNTVEHTRSANGWSQDQALRQVARLHGERP